jgi:hypothetical protein
MARLKFEMNPTQARNFRAFLRGLEALTRKHRIQVVTCECCGTWLRKVLSAGVGEYINGLLAGGLQERQYGDTYHLRPKARDRKEEA